MARRKKIIRWGPLAVPDLEQIHTYRKERNPTAAQEFAKRVLVAVEQLRAHSHLGRLPRLFSRSVITDTASAATAGLSIVSMDLFFGSCGCGMRCKPPPGSRSRNSQLEHLNVAWRRYSYLGAELLGTSVALVWA